MPPLIQVACTPDAAFQLAACVIAGSKADLSPGALTPASDISGGAGAC